MYEGCPGKVIFPSLDKLTEDFLVIGFKGGENAYLKRLYKVGKIKR